MDLENFLKYLKDEKKKFDEEDIAAKVLKEEEMKKMNDIKKIINEIEMEIENEKKGKKKSEAEEKNDEESTIDGEINIINELKNI